MNIEVRHFTLTSPAGSFVFTRDTILSHAKLVRDTITAVAFRGTEDGSKGPTRGTAQKWFREHVDGPAKNTLFTWERTVPHII